MNFYQKFASDVMLGGFAKVVISMETLLLLPFLTKFLGVSDYGVLNQIVVTVILLSIIAELGLTKSSIRFLAGKTDKNQISRDFFAIITLCFLTGAVLSLALFLTAKPFALLILKDITAINFLKIASPLLLLTVLVDCTAIFFNIFRNMKSYFIIYFFQTAGNVGLIMYLLFRGYGLMEVILAYLAVKALAFAVSMVLLRTKIPFKTPNFMVLKPYLKFALPIAPLAFFGWVVHSSDIYFISFFHTSADVGIYSAVYVFSKIIFLLMAPIVLVLYPALSKEWDNKNFKRVRVLISNSARYFFLFAIPTTAGLTLLGKDILSILTTQAFVSGYILFPFIVLGLVVWKLSDLLSHILLLIKNTKLIGKIYFIGAFANIVLNFILIPEYGLMGAATATFLSYFIVFMLMLRATMMVRFDWNLNFILKSIFASLLMVFIIRFIPIASLSSLVFSILTGAIIYFSAMFLINGIKREEIRLFFYLLRTFIRLDKNKI